MATFSGKYPLTKVTFTIANSRDLREGSCPSTMNRVKKGSRLYPFVSLTFTPSGELKKKLLHLPPELPHGGWKGRPPLPLGTT